TMNNHRASELLGLTDDQMKGKVAIDPAWKFVHEDNTPLSLDEYPVKRIVTGKKPIKNQVLGIHQPTKNDIVWVSVNGFPVLNNSGEIIEIVISFIDVTDSKQSELLLQEKAEEIEVQNEELNQTNQELAEARKNAEINVSRMKMALDVSNSGAWDWDILKNTFYWSDEFLQLFGLPENTIAGFEAWTKALHPDDVEMASAKIQEAIENRTELLNDYRIILPNNEIRWIRATGHADYVDNKPVRMIGLCMDITWQKLAEINLEQKNANIKAIIEGTKESVWAFNTNYEILYVNKTFQLEFQQTFGVWLEPGVNMVESHPEPIRFLWKSRYDKVLTNVQFTIEDSVDTENGMLYVHVTFTPIVRNGEVIGGSCIGSNITNRKLAEQELIKAKLRAEESEAIIRAAMENSHAGIAIAEVPSGKLKYVNKAGLLIRGREYDEIVKDIDLDQYVSSWQILHFDGTPYQSDEVPLARAILYGETSSREFIVRRDNNEDRYVWANAAPIYNEKGIQTSAIVVFLDITDKKLAEFALERSNEELQKAKEKAEKSEQNLLKTNEEYRRSNQLLDESQSLAKLGGWELDLSTNQLYWTSETFNIHDTSPEEFNPTVDAGVSYFLPESKKTIIAALELAMTQGTGYDLILETYTTKGRKIDVRTTCQVTMLDGKPVKLTGIFQDITDIKLAEEKLRKSEEQNKAIVLSTPDHIIMNDKDLKYTLVVNPQMGLTEQDMLGKTDYDFLSKEDADNLTTTKTRVIETGESLHFETSLISAVGKEEFFDGSYIPTFDANAEPNGLIGYFRNVTERKQSELLLQEKTAQIESQNEEYQIINEELKQTNKELTAANELVEKSEMQARDILQTAMDGFWMVDNESRFINVNQVACKMLGYSREEMLTMTISDVDCEETADQTKRHLQKVIKTGEDRFETKHRCKDGKIIDVEVSVKVQNSQDLIVVFVHNITERKIAEEKLKALEQQSHAWLENSPTCTKIVDLDFNLQFMSSAGIKGLKIDDITPYYGKPYPFHFYPESFKTKMTGNMIRAIETREVITQEAPVVDINGNEVWYHSTIVPAKDDNGQIEYLIIVSMDTTERKHAEERLRESEAIKNTMVSNIGDVIVIIDQNGINRYKSPNITTLFGWQPEELVGKSTWDTVHPDDLDAARKFIATLATEPYAKGTTEIRYKRKDGKYVWIEITMANLLSDPDINGLLGNYHDITERKLAEEELKSVKASLELCLEASQIGIWSHDITEDPEHIKQVSVRDLKHDQIFGYKEKIASWGQEKMLEHVIDEDREATRKAFDNVFEKGRLDFECRILWPDNTIHWIACGGKVYKDSAGQPNQINGTVMDITERKLAEQELIIAKEHAEESEAYLRSVLQSNKDVIVSRDLNNNVVFFNKAFDDVTMELFNQHAFAGMNTLKLLPTEARAFWENILQKVKNGETHEEEYQYKTLLKPTDYRTSHVPVLHGSKVVGTLEITKDITSFKNREEELKQAKEKAEESEEKFKLVFDRSLVAILIANDKGDYLSANNAAADLLGYPIEELLKMNVADLKTTIKPDAHDRYLKYLEIGEEKGEFDFITKSEEHKIAYYHAVRIKSDFNLSMLINITNQKKTEQDLLIAKLHAEESDRLKSAFLANMSHEIRTPMNGILGFAELLKESDLTGEQQQEYIKIIEKSGARMLNIINDIVDISKIESGLMKLNISETNVNEQIEYVYTFFRPEIESKGIRFAFKNALTAKEAIIKTDREKVYAILTNLVKNAIKYTEKGSIEFGYVSTGSTTGSVSEPVELLQFYVKDTGIGIPKDRQDAIFERFIQADIVDVQARQGAGLGLAISKSYVEILGGKIWVEGEMGLGSTFYFTLPYNAEPVIETINQQFAPSAITEPIRKLKILIAEDDEVSEMLIDITAKTFGKEILKVRSGVEAVEACRDNPDIDLILMDIRMPEMGGYEATQKIREFNKDVVIIAQTAYGLSGDREKAIKAGCNDYISKPIKKDELLSLIQKYF
ncbi:MAG: PAS domain S-box protein, partial [Prolixibacteraceae bacterium]|nr:PAS domain S-box protein [Prolixibacteraceae bacterium]